MINGCPKCEKLPEFAICLDCQIKQADWDLAVAMGRLETLQKMKEIEKEQESELSDSKR